MVRKMIQLLYKEFSGLHQAAFLLAISSLLSQILALVRFRLLASEFGATLPLDIYYTSFRVPDLIYVAIASFVSVTVLIPFIVKRDGEKKDRYQVESFINSIFTIFFLVMVIVSAILFIAMPYLSRIIAPGFDEESLDFLTQLSQVMLLSPFFLGLSNLFGSVTQAYNKFLAYTLSPLFYNIGIIIGIVGFYPFFGLVGLAWGVVLGAFMHLLIQLPGLIQSGIRPRLVQKMNWAEIKEVVLTSLPRTIVLSSHQLSILILLAIGSFMATGSIAIFNFAFNLQSVPLMIVGVSYSVAAFPTLSKLFGAGESTRFVEQVSLAVRHILFWSLPIISLFIVLRAQIVRVILGSGEFSWTDTRLTAAALAIFIISVAGQSLIQLFVRSYYAGGKTREPLIINSLSSVMVVLLTVLLLRAFDNYPIFRYFIESLLRVDDVSATPVLMLPFGFTLGMLLNTVLLWYYFQKDFGLLNRQIANTFFQSFSAAVCAGFISYITLTIFAGIFDLNTFWGILGQGLLAGIGGIIATIIILRILGSHELAEFIEAFRARFRRTRPIVAEPEEL